MAKLTDDADYDAAQTFENVPSPLSDAGNHDNYYGRRLRTSSVELRDDCTSGEPRLHSSASDQRLRWLGVPGRASLAPTSAGLGHMYPSHLLTLSTLGRGGDGVGANGGNGSGAGGIFEGGSVLQNASRGAFTAGAHGFTPLLLSSADLNPASRNSLNSCAFVSHEGVVYVPMGRIPGYPSSLSSVPQSPALGNRYPVAVCLLTICQA
ncbi:unnamed protein product [Protopolystoma xenopodis]|uniref:Uncharacterized protein n=1 Tax=Protopolystoma xenopodis TaxID=117903 RepID=A0A448XGX7_9PLAT|nr:unnamed protein product [Protopolystoma xenopodis]